MIYAFITNELYLLLSVQAMQVAANQPSFSLYQQMDQRVDEVRSALIAQPELNSGLDANAMSEIIAALVLGRITTTSIACIGALK